MGFCFAETRAEEGLEITVKGQNAEILISRILRITSFVGKINDSFSPIPKHPNKTEQPKKTSQLKILSIHICKSKSSELTYVVST